MSILKKYGVIAVVLLTLGLLLFVSGLFSEDDRSAVPARPSDPEPRSHLDHTPFFTADFEKPQDVTKACLKCHEKAASDFMKTSHWLWLGDETTVPGHDKPVRIGKKNLINNFCIGISGNWKSCTKCHPGYGWADDSFDFTKAENVDCLICHDGTDTYTKGVYGMPTAGIDLKLIAQKVKYPRRSNCLTCHGYGGGGEGVKHGDIDASLDNPYVADDVHMGRYKFLCIDCHKADNHAIRGRAFSVGTEDAHGLACTDCHNHQPHADDRINRHVTSVACQTCHIPTFARRHPTKMDWDWSKAGDATRPEDPHGYLKIKGEFVYDHDVVPDYAWFNMTMDRYLAGDKLDPSAVTDINRPRGDIRDRTAMLWPFKIHMAKQPYDEINKYILLPVTGGESGYWQTFDWDQSFKLAEKFSNLPYSGRYGFAQTRMFWPLSHGVTPKEKALRCQDCHGPDGRMDWKALGYPNDPIKAGGRS